jgi:hypothetical protein
VPLSLYSKRFYAQQGVNVTTTISGPHVGFIWIVRDITAYINNLGLGVFCLFKISSTNSVFYAASGQAFNQSLSHFDGRVVLIPGDNIVIEPNGNNWDVQISGYELTAP